MECVTTQLISGGHMFPVDQLAYMESLSVRTTVRLHCVDIWHKAVQLPTFKRIGPLCQQPRLYGGVRVFIHFEWPVLSTRFKYVLGRR